MPTQQGLIWLVGVGSQDGTPFWTFHVKTLCACLLKLEFSHGSF